MKRDPLHEQRPERVRALGLDDRFVLAILTVATALLLIVAFLWLGRGVRVWQTRDLERHARLVATLLAPDLAAAESDPTESFDRVATDERVHGLLLCRGNQTLLGSSAIRGWLDCDDPPIRAAVGGATAIDTMLSTSELFVSAHPLPDGRSLVVVQDRSLMARRGRTITELALLAALAASALAGVLFWALSRAARSGARRRLADLLRRATRNRSAQDLPAEIGSLIRALDDSVAQRRREREALDPAESGSSSLRRLVEERMPQTRLVLIANREPYIHLREGERVIVNRPASGLVTGVEPLLRACGGVWIGHGSGNADREFSDPKGRLAVPPENPEYVLRRVWLTRKEEEGYYYGFSNEGLWPLCHIAHARPTFRESDWNAYQAVNRRFAEVAAEEAGEHGLVLVQDYHFGRLPAELRKLAPDSVISLFWHIPWPNQEVVGICPWTEPLLDGMLGADVIGFHTRYHCLNFLDTVGRYLEARVDLETMSVEYGGHTTRVKPYPISVEWPYPAATPEQGRKHRSKLGLDDTFVFLGIDRADYTKGLLERVWAMDALLTAHPELHGRVAFVQLAAPSRTHIKRYRDLISELEEAVTAINRKFASDGWEPIRFELRHGGGDEVRRLYAMADCAVVTPLHDGMNLVAKEYVASRTAEDGALVLSIFTGAAKELEGALLVNPYNTSEVAAAMFRAYTMHPEERRARMRAMRAAITRNTIYDWSASLLSDMAEIWRVKQRNWKRGVPETGTVPAEQARR
ncbi:MAG TPA: trehalose-6-phosphate synthase [Thermoanaerobaculia bacterium]|nr:trehalose-6-phosphate synthase [Thermoanaerobaculia bacterium]